MTPDPVSRDNLIELMREGQAERELRAEREARGESDPSKVVGQPNHVAHDEQREWLERASDLLAEPDPGPTPFLVENLIVDRAIAAVVGPYKVFKTWLMLELAIAIVTGKNALGICPVPETGPVILIVEESGRSALHRRLDRLMRGYALSPTDLSGIHFSANRRVRLNEPEWQEELLAAGRSLKPRAIMLDPFVRLKGATVDENIQREVGPVLDYLRDLRDGTDAAVIYSHHTGHQGGHMRGSSDLEGYWESCIRIKPKDETKDDGVRTLTAEHREAESGYELKYRLSFDEASQSIRLEHIHRELDEKVRAYLGQHPDASANAVFDALGGSRPDVLASVKRIKQEVVPNAGYQPVPEGVGTTGAAGTSSPHTPRRGVGAGYQSQRAGTADPGTADDQAEVERLAEKYREEKP